MVALQLAQVSRAADTIPGIVISDAEHIVEEIALLKTRGATRRRLTLPSECVAYSPTPPNPAGFEPRIPHVSKQRTYSLAYSNSAPVSSQPSHI